MRRHLGSGFLGAVLAAALAGQKTPEAALAELRAGNARFVQDKCAAQTYDTTARRRLAEGQHPFAIVLCCADARVPPEHVFDAGLGDLFVVRVAGNVCDPEILASMEYAAEHLGAQVGVVLGHEGCDTVKACVEHDPADRVQPSAAAQALWQRIEPAVHRARALRPGTEPLVAAEEENVHHTVSECLRRSAVLRGLAAAGRFKLVPARYRLASGAVDWLAERPFKAPAAKGTPPPAPGRTVAPHVALQHLQDGHRRYLAASAPAGDVSRDRRTRVAKHQRPLAVVVTCADARVAPEHLFDCGLGDLFVVRVAGNVLNDDVLASVDHAVEHTGAALVLGLGHSLCGAVHAACQAGAAPAASPNMARLLAHIAPAVEAARAEGHGGDALWDRAVELNVLGLVEGLRSRSQLLQGRERNGQLALLGAVYQLDTGELKWLDGTGAAPAGEVQRPTRQHATHR